MNFVTDSDAARLLRRPKTNHWVVQLEVLSTLVQQVDEVVQPERSCQAFPLARVMRAGEAGRIWARLLLHAARSFLPSIPLEKGWVAAAERRAVPNCLRLAAFLFVLPLPIGVRGKFAILHHDSELACPAY